MNPYIIHLGLYDLGFLAVVLVGLTFALLLWAARTSKRIANRFLALALATVIFQISWILGIKIQLTQCIPQWSWLPFQFSSALGPLIYFYMLYTTSKGYKFHFKNFIHFMPALLQLAAHLLAVKASIKTEIPTYQTLIFQHANPAFQCVTFISFTIYLYKAHLLIEKFYQKQQFQDGDRHRNQLRWLHRWLLGFGFLCLLCIPFAVMDHFYMLNLLGVPAYHFLYFLLALLIICLAAKTLLREIATQVNTMLVSKPRIPAELRQKAIGIKRSVKENRYYLDPELTLSSLAEKLELIPHELSRIINTGFNKSFNDFINEYRVKAIIQKMQLEAYDHLTLLGIAYESGFNSKTTFNRAFKQLKGISPAEYKDLLKKERPTYNLGRYAHPEQVISNHDATPMWSLKKANQNFMVRNYFKIGWRNLTRNKGYAVINVTGLAIGIAACLLIFLVIRYETSFDNFHKNRDRIYRVINVTQGPDGITPGSGTQVPLADGLRVDFPELSNVGSIMLNDGSHYSIEDENHIGTVKKFKEDSAYYADPQFFQIFNFKWLAGNQKTALASPNAMVLSRDEADKFFGDWHKAIGKTVKYENKTDFKVTGIIENTPPNTDFAMKVLMSWITLVSKGGELSGSAQNWTSTYQDRNTYIVLPANVSKEQFNAQLASFATKHIPEPYNKTISLQLQPLTDMHYNTLVATYGGHPFGRRLVNVISLIGLFLLIIACVNFINLATAQAINRSKEVGIRKVLGSNRPQLISQFIIETLIITLFAVTLAAAISVIALPMLNRLLEINLSRNFLLNPTVILYLMGLVVCVTFLAGFYPALVLSGFNPVAALKNKFKARHSSGITLRRVLVVTQFCIAQFLLIGTIVLIFQMDYFNNKSLGFNKDAVIIVPFPGDSLARTRVNALKNQLLLQPGIKDVSISRYGPAGSSGWTSDFKYNNSAKEVDFQASLKWADPEFFKLYDMQFVAGAPYKNTDTISGYVVNETLIHKLGITDPRQAMGKYIMVFNDPRKNVQITGVVKDFNAGSLRDPIPPIIMAPLTSYSSKLNIKMASGNATQTLASIETLWNKTFPDGVYEYQFLEKTIADFYKTEDQLSKLYKIFAGIAIFISCLGLYGLVSFMAVQRTKEVGIRKTLGASVGHIVYLFSKEFTILLIIAFCISTPIGYYFMYKWLQDFTYRITIGPRIFVLSLLASVLMAWLAVGYKAVKAALVNPIKSMRSE